MDLPCLFSRQPNQEFPIKPTKGTGTPEVASSYRGEEGVDGTVAVENSAGKKSNVDDDGSDAGPRHAPDGDAA